MRYLILCLMTAMTLVGARTAVGDAPAPVRIALVADTHTTRGTHDDEPLYAGRLVETITAVNAARVDLVLIAGDLTQSGKPEDMADFQQQIKGFQAPVLCVPGNHDVGGKHIPGQPGGVTAARVATYEVAFGPSFWVSQTAGVRIIGLNASLLGSGLPREADQWGFLEAQLAHPSTVPTLVVLHYPPFLVSPDEPGGIYWNIEPGPRQRLLSLLKSGGVAAVLSGHLHRPLVNHWEGMLLETTPPVSFGLPRGKQPEGWTLVTVPAQGDITCEFQPIPD